MKASMETTKVRLGDSDINVAVSDAEKVTKLDAENSEKSKRIDSLKGQIKELQAKLEEEEGKVLLNKLKDMFSSGEKEIFEYTISETYVNNGSHYCSYGSCKCAGNNILAAKYIAKRYGAFY